MKWIPVELIQLIIQEKKEEAFRIYVLVNYSKSGFFSKDRETLEWIMRECSIKSMKTLRKHLNDLRGLNLLGYHEKSFYIRSSKLWLNKSKQRVEFHSMFFSKWKSYLYGSFLGWLAHRQRLKEREVSRSIKKRASYQRAPSSFPVSIASITTILQVSEGKACNMKKSAEVDNFIRIKKQEVQKVCLPKASLKYIDFSKGQFFEHKGNVYNQAPDQVIPLLRYKKGRKLKHI